MEQSCRVRLWASSKYSESSLFNLQKCETYFFSKKAGNLRIRVTLSNCRVLK